MNSEAFFRWKNSLPKKGHPRRTPPPCFSLVGLWAVCFELFATQQDCGEVESLGIPRPLKPQCQIRSSWITAAFSSPWLRRAVATLDEFHGNHPPKHQPNMKVWLMYFPLKNKGWTLEDVFSYWNNPFFKDMWGNSCGKPFIGLLQVYLKYSPEIGWWLNHPLKNLQNVFLLTQSFGVKMTNIR